MHFKVQFEPILEAEFDVIADADDATEQPEENIIPDKLPWG